MIELRDVSFSYIDNGRQRQVLSHVSLAIGEGEFVCVAGPSGCGKTTLLRLMAGLQLPSAGMVTVGEKPVTGPQKDTAVVFQDYALFPWMTAYGNVRFCIRQTRQELTAAETDRLARQALADVGLAGAAQLHPYQMSGGMRQRAAMARALATDKKILLLDEPFGALDAKNRADLQELLEARWNADPRSRKTIVFITHDIREAVLLADRVLLMRPGGAMQEYSIQLPRPRRILSGADAESMRTLRRELAEQMMDPDGYVGRCCRCGGPV